MIGSIYILLGIIILFREVARIVYNQKVDYMTIFDIYFMGYYVIPAAVHNLIPAYRSRYYYIISYGDGTFTACIAVCLSYLLVTIGFSQIDKLIFSNRLGNHISKEEYCIPNENHFFWRAVYLMWIIGILSFIIHCVLFGGIKNVIFNSTLIRNGDIESEGSGSLLFISKLVSCLMYASYLVFIKYLKKETSKSIFFFSIALAALYLIVNAGRGAIISYVIILIFIYSNTTKRKIKLRTWLFMFFAVTLGITYLRPLLSSLTQLGNGFGAVFSAFMSEVNSSTNTTFSFNNLIYRMCYYLEHKYVSLEVSIKAIKSQQYNFNLFYIDIFAGLIAIIPEMFLPFKKPETISATNTYLINLHSRYDTGTIPPGGIAFGYYGLGMVGVMLVSMIFGSIGKKISIYFDSFDSDYMRALKFINVFSWVDFYINGDLRQCVVRNFVFLVLILVIRVKRKQVKCLDK